MANGSKFDFLSCGRIDGLDKQYIYRGLVSPGGGVIHR